MGAECPVAGRAGARRRVSARSGGPALRGCRARPDRRESPRPHALGRGREAVGPRACGLGRAPAAVIVAAAAPSARHTGHVPTSGMSSCTVCLIIARCSRARSRRSARAARPRAQRRLPGPRSPPRLLKLHLGALRAPAQASVLDLQRVRHRSAVRPLQRVHRPASRARRQPVDSDEYSPSRRNSRRSYPPEGGCPRLGAGSRPPTRIGPNRRPVLPVMQKLFGLTPRREASAPQPATAASSATDSRSAGSARA